MQRAAEVAPGPTEALVVEHMRRIMGESGRAAEVRPQESGTHGRNSSGIHLVTHRPPYPFLCGMLCPPPDLAPLLATALALDSGLGLHARMVQRWWRSTGA